MGVLVPRLVIGEPADVPAVRVREIDLEIAVPIGGEQDMAAVGRLLTAAVVALVAGQLRHGLRPQVQPADREAALPVALEHDAGAVSRETPPPLPRLRP